MTGSIWEDSGFRKQERFRELVDATGMSREKLSRTLGINSRTLRRYLSGDSPLMPLVEMAVSYVIEHPELHLREA